MYLKFKNRFKINEELSVSPIVSKMAKEVTKQLVFKTENAKKYIADDKNLIITKGILNFDCKKYLKRLDVLKVIYVIYYLDDEKQYEYYDRIGMFPRSADYENANIKVHLAYVKGQPSIQFVPSIKHELNHIFQYDCGAKKNISFYDTVIDRYKNGEMWEKKIAWALYLSFKTEQDAFVTQFDEYLRQKGVSKQFLPKDDNNPYFQFDRAFVAVERLDVDENKLKESFGITINQLYSMLNSADERLFKKMSHVWAKYTYESKKKIMQPNVSEMNFLMECYQNGIYEKVSDKTW